MKNQQIEILRKACEVCDGIANARIYKTLSINSVYHFISWMW